VPVPAATRRPENERSLRISIEHPLAGSSRGRPVQSRPRGLRAQRLLPTSGLAHPSGSCATTTPSESAASSNDLAPAPCSELTSVVKIGQHSFANGGFSDVFKGKMLTDRGQYILVAIKVLRVPGSNSDEPETAVKLNARLDRERKVWSSLNHPNVLPFMGVSREFGSFPALISPFCASRDVVSYLKRYPHVNRRPIALGLTDGLRYIHSKNVLHGDLKGSNVLIGSEGEALICDFGVSKVIGCRGFTTNLAGTPPFMAPELFPDFDVDIDGDVVIPLTKETDIWAYGLVLLQILTGKDPRPHYFGIPRTKFLPSHRYYSPINDQLWSLVESCCHLDPEKRPTVDEVMERIPSIDIIYTLPEPSLPPEVPGT